MNYFGYNMMGWEGGGSFIVGFFNEVVWLVAGVLLIVWLWREINRRP